MIRFAALLLTVSSLVFGNDTGSAAQAARAIQNAGLDDRECYRVRDLVFNQEDIRFYLTDGFLIFGKPIDGRRVSAVFTAAVDGGDGEVLVFPPHRSERLSLSSFAGTPNLDEHLTAAVFLFTNGTAEQLMAQLRSGAAKKVPDMGLLMAGKWNPVVKNLSSSLEIRLVQDHFSQDREQGFLYAAVSGKQLGNFDLSYDPRAREQISVGQLAARDNRAYFNIWTSFLARPWRTQGRPPFTDDLAISDVRINAVLQPDLHLKAVTRMKLTPSKATNAAMSFEISRSMRVTGAKVDNEPAEVFMRESLRANAVRGSENELFLLISARPLEPGRAHEIEFSHEGDVISSAGNGVYFVGSRGNWYPNRGGGFAQYELTFKYPKALNLVATGDVVSEETDGDSRITRRKTSSPIRFAGFNLGEYARASVTRAGTTVEVYANRKIEAALERKPPRDLIVLPQQPWSRGARPPADLQGITAAAPPRNPTARLQELATEIASAMEFMSATFGPSPLKTLTVSPIPGTFGQGFPGLLYISTLSYLNPKERPNEPRGVQQQMFYSDLLHAHEVAHQWWGNIVTSADYQDDWIMESLANYSALLFLEKKKGRKAVDAILTEYKAHLLQKTPEGHTLESAGPIIWGTRLISSQAPTAWRAITYEKGSWIVHMLRGRLGDERFLKMLAELARRYRYRSLTTEQFRETAAAFVPPKSDDPKLESFFEQWVYGTGVPTLKLNYTIAGKAPAVKVRGTVTQTGVDEDFSASVPVEVQLTGKQTSIRWVHTSSEPTPFSVDLKQSPLRVLLDPGGSILAVRK